MRTSMEPGVANGAELAGPVADDGRVEAADEEVLS
jgi:hypothetical protein